MSDKMFNFIKKGYLHDLIWKYGTKKTVTQNGTDIDVAGLDKIDVNVPNPSTGTLQITENGEGINVTQYAAVDVNVPNPSTGTLQITQNGVGINVTQYAAVDVNVPSGGQTMPLIINVSKPSSATNYNIVLMNNYSLDNSGYYDIVGDYQGTEGVNIGGASASGTATVNRSGFYSPAYPGSPAKHYLYDYLLVRGASASVASITLGSTNCTAAILTTFTSTYLYALIRVSGLKNDNVVNAPEITIITA